MEIGSEVRLQTADGQFAGVVFEINRQLKCLTLKDGKYYLIHDKLSKFALCLIMCVVQMYCSRLSAFVYFIAWCY